MRVDDRTDVARVDAVASQLVLEESRGDHDAAGVAAQCDVDPETLGRCG